MFFLVHFLRAVLIFMRLGRITYNTLISTVISKFLFPVCSRYCTLFSTVGTVLSLYSRESRERERARKQYLYSFALSEGIRSNPTQKDNKNKIVSLAQSSKQCKCRRREKLLSTEDLLCNSSSLVLLVLPCIVARVPYDPIKVILGDNHCNLQV